MWEGVSMYSDIASNYDLFFSKTTDYASDVGELLSNYPQSNEKPVFLDYGCGTGGHALEVLRNTDGFVVCYDVSENMLKETKEKLSLFKERVFLTSNFQDLFCYKYDCIYSFFYVVNHFLKKFHWDALVSICERSLKIGSSVIFDIYNRTVVMADPPSNYTRNIERDGDHYSKECIASLSDDIITMKYKIYSPFSKIVEVESMLKMRLWSLNYIDQIFKKYQKNIYGKNFKKFDENEYHFICSFKKTTI